MKITLRKVNTECRLHGKLDIKKVEKAIEIAFDKYCSVVKNLEETARIIHSYEIKTN
jgi:uncharacterized OsmC-like protein